MVEQTNTAVPAVPFLHIETDGSAHLIGSLCNHCKAVMPGERRACAACGARKQLETISLGTRGSVESHTIVHRSYPGTRTPFISVVVRLQGGATLKGTLLDVPPDPASVASITEVDVVYRDTGQNNSKGERFVSYYFVPTAGDAT